MKLIMREESQSSMITLKEDALTLKRLRNKRFLTFLLRPFPNSLKLQIMTC